MIYEVIVKAKVESNLVKDLLEKNIALSLCDVESQYLKFNGVDENLEVIDCELTEANEICPHCETKLVSRIFDVDGTNLVEHNICEECGYGTPALV